MNWHLQEKKKKLHRQVQQSKYREGKNNCAWWIGCKDASSSIAKQPLLASQSSLAAPGCNQGAHATVNAELCSPTSIWLWGRKPANGHGPLVIGPVQRNESLREPESQLLTQNTSIFLEKLGRKTEWYGFLLLNKSVKHKAASVPLLKWAQNPSIDIAGSYVVFCSFFSFSVPWFEQNTLTRIFSIYLNWSTGGSENLRCDHCGVITIYFKELP